MAKTVEFIDADKYTKIMVRCSPQYVGRAPLHNDFCNPIMRLESKNKNLLIYKTIKTDDNSKVAVIAAFLKPCPDGYELIKYATRQDVENAIEKWQQVPQIYGELQSQPFKDLLSI